MTDFPWDQYKAAPTIKNLETDPFEVVAPGQYICSLAAFGNIKQSSTTSYWYMITTFMLGERKVFSTFSGSLSLLHFMHMHKDFFVGKPYKLTISIEEYNGISHNYVKNIERVLQ